MYSIDCEVWSSLNLSFMWLCTYSAWLNATYIWKKKKQQAIIIVTQNWSQLYCVTNQPLTESPCILHFKWVKYFAFMHKLPVHWHKQTGKCICCGKFPLVFYSFKDICRYRMSDRDSKQRTRITYLYVISALFLGRKMYRHAAFIIKTTSFWRFL